MIRQLAAAAIVLAIVSPLFAAGFIEMIPQPQLNHGISINGISADGTVVVGTDADQHAFRWQIGSAALEPITPAGVLNNAFGVSGDGKTVVGRFDLPTKAFKWTSSGGIVNLGKIVSASNPDPATMAFDASFDGSVIVGKSDNQAFRWSQSTGLVPMGFAYCCYSEA